MATLTFEVPDTLLADLHAALRQAMRSDAEGLTDREVITKWIGQQTTQPLMAYRLRRDVAGRVAAEQAAREVAEAALETERQARLTAEAAVRVTVDADVGAIA